MLLNRFSCTPYVVLKLIINNQLIFGYTSTWTYNYYINLAMDNKPP